MEIYTKSFYLYLDSDLYITSDLTIKPEYVHHHRGYPFIKADEF